MKIPFDQLIQQFERVLLGLNFTPDKALACATIFASNSRDGVYTHGLSRFPTFVSMVKGGYVKPDAEPAKLDGFGAIERWDGNLGPGMLTATICMDRAMKLADEHGVGVVALKNTNHWMRGGTYGWRAADKGFIGICFTNTIANLPPWGGLDPRLGNNPLVIAVPRAGGNIVLDMAISQYSVGKLNQYKNNGEQLPLPGGYNDEGDLSTDPDAILQSKRLLPVGFWKGSGLSLMLDLLASVLSGGQSTAAVSRDNVEYGMSQVFIAIKPVSDDQTDSIIGQIIDYTKTSRPVSASDLISYPGENTLRTRERNLREGVPVDEKIWQQVLEM